jgi:ubiquinone/menaquinone biosynthesis C-methylase UbiE
MVEHVFSEPFTDERYSASAKKLDPCLEIRKGMWRRSSLSIDRLRMVCEFEAPDAEAMREALHSAHLSYERVWTASVYAVEDYPELMDRLRVLLGESPTTASPAEGADSDSNEEAAAAWNGVLFDKFVRFRDVITRGFSRHSDAALQRHPPPAGGHVLDVGCGFGDVTAAIGRALGKEGMVSGVDVADRFVGEARAEAARQGLTNARFFRADVQTDDVGGPYDMIFSRFGTMFFASPVAAMRNLAASLRPGGLLCTVVWRRREDNPFVHVAEQVVRGLLPERKDSSEPTCGPGPFSMASADVTSDILGRAGFDRVGFERCDAPVCIGRDIGEAAQFAIAIGPAGEIVRLSGEEGQKRMPAILAGLADALRPYVTAEGVVMPSSSWIVTARR